MFQEPRECSIGGKNRKFNAMKERSAVRMEKEARRKEKFKENLVKSSKDFSAIPLCYSLSVFLDQGIISVTYFTNSPSFQFL
jgi:hypothetical protein